MPIYEYWCRECKAQFEKLRPMGSNDREIACPRCGSPVKKMLSVVAAVGRTSGGESYSMGGGCACGGGGCGCGGRH
ncbi:MAG TPA: zinc ribbon domain-containing protein [Chloroflexia bacterium]|nr:zinc ribbon domain-containing protein [Chloroflexia bacterium]